MQILRSVHADDAKYKTVVAHLISTGLLSGDADLTSFALLQHAC